jgi:hypothetical protein
MRLVRPEKFSAKLERNGVRGGAKNSAATLPRERSHAG